MFLAIVDPSLLQLMLWFVSFIALFTVMSMAKLRRSEEAVRKTNAKLEDQVVAQQHELMRSRDAAAAWRLEMQRQFDAFRADSSKQINDAEQRASAIQQHLNATMARSWKTEAELRQSLDRALQLATTAPGSVETSEAPGAGQQLEALQAALEASEQKTAALQQALTIERFRHRRAMKQAQARA